MSRDSIRALVDALDEDTGWGVYEHIAGVDADVVGGDGDTVAAVFGNAAHLATPGARAAFIAASRTAVPLLLAVADAAAEMPALIDAAMHGAMAEGVALGLGVKRLRAALAALDATR